MMSAIKKFKSLPRPVRYIIITVCTLIVLFVLTVFVIPAVVKAVAASQLTKTLGRKTSIEDISFNPATLTVEIRGFAMNEPNSEKVFVSFDLLRIDAEIVSAFKRGGILREISLVKPYVNLVRQETNAYNFSDMLTGKEKEKETPKEPQKPFRFSLNNISITEGRIDFDDKPVKKHHSVTDINLGVPLVSNFNYNINTFVQPLFSARINGKPFTLTGQTKPFPEFLFLFPCP